MFEYAVDMILIKWRVQTIDEGRIMFKSEDVRIKGNNTTRSVTSYATIIEINYKYNMHIKELDI